MVFSKCFPIFFIFTPNLGEMIHFDLYFAKGLVQPPIRNLLHAAGRACLIGGALVELSAVRVMSSEMVQCRVPVWQQVLGRGDRG